MFESGCFPRESSRFFDIFVGVEKRLGVWSKTPKRLV